ncbi:MAG: glycine cleavage system protein GcvH [Deltaproteobacteria bacterium]|nr:glycine cleavage system protein GcvH [Deltaproteobacteria bacterium]
MGTIPANLKYTKDHEWAKVEGKTLTMGITAFATEQLGDIVFVDLPKKGAALKAGATCGAVESTKAVSDVFSPVTGTVLEANAALSDAPETINQDPYEKGWLVKIELANPAELEGLMDAAKYEEHVKHSAH